MALYIANSQIDDLGQNAIAFGKGRPVVDLGPRLNPFLNESAPFQIEALSNFSTACDLHKDIAAFAGGIPKLGPLSRAGKRLGYRQQRRYGNRPAA